MKNAQSRSVKSSRGRPARCEVRLGQEQRNVEDKPVEPQGSPALGPTKEQIEKAKAANVANIFRKLKSGGTLKADELSILDQFDEEPKDRTALPVYDSIAQCAASTGIPLPALKKAKRSGCPAFKSNRVYLASFLQWWFSRADADEDIDWSKELKKTQTLREQIKLGEDRDLVVEVERVLLNWDKNVSRARAMFDAKFRSELPAKQGGLPADQIAKMNSETLNEIYATLSKPLP